MITLDEMKEYLRVDTAEDDDLISSLMDSAEALCMDVARVDSKEEFEGLGNARLSVLFTTAYMYEHRVTPQHYKPCATFSLTLNSKHLIFSS